jgi:chromosome partitioning protein
MGPLRSTAGPVPKIPELMGNVIAVANQKGGVGKSTTALSLGHALHERRKKVLLVDLDSQAHLTLMSGVELGAGDMSAYDVLMDGVLAADAIQEIAPGLEIVPASIQLATGEVDLSRRSNREYRLKEGIQAVRQIYDFTIMDCPPNLGLLTVNALTAADSVLIPLQLDFLALRGMQLLLNTISEVRASTNRGLELLGILPTMARARSLHSAEVEASVREFFGDTIFKTVVRSSVRFPEAAAGFRSILEYAPRHPGSEAYRSLAREVLQRTATRVGISA